MPLGQSFSVILRTDAKQHEAAPLVNLVTSVKEGKAYEMKSQATIMRSSGFFAKNFLMTRKILDGCLEVILGLQEVSTLTCVKLIPQLFFSLRSGFGGKSSNQFDFQNYPLRIPSPLPILFGFFGFQSDLILTRTRG